MSAAHRTPFGLVLVLLFSGVLAAGQFAKISVTFPTFRLLFPEHGAALGFLVSTVSIVGVICGLFAGVILGRIGFRLPLTAALLLGAVASVFQSFYPTFGWFVLSRTVEGLSHLLIVVAAPTLIGQICAPHHRAIFLTLWSSVFAVSFAVFAWVGLPFSNVFGVPALFLLHGGLLLGAAAAVWSLLPSGILPRTLVPLSLRMVIERHVAAYSSAYIIAPALGWLFYAMGFVALVTVLPDYFSPDSSVALRGFLPLSALLVSLTLGMALVRRFSPIQITILGFVISAALPLLLLLGVSAEVAGIAALGSLGLVASGSFSAIPALNTNGEHQALANGALAQMGNTGNLIGTPLLLFMTQMFDVLGLVMFAFVAFGLGAASHLWLGRVRRLHSEFG